MACPKLPVTAGYHSGGCFICTTGFCGPEGGCNCQECFDYDAKTGRNAREAAYGPNCKKRNAQSK